MFPSIPSGATLSLSQRDANDIVTGDVICYLAPEGPLVAHRVVDMSRVPDFRFLTRGDLDPTLIWVPATSVLGVVETVAWRGLRYRTGGIVGRFLKQESLKGKSLFFEVQLALLKVFRKTRAVLRGQP
jgi:hypothetical protein